MRGLLSGEGVDDIEEYAMLFVHSLRQDEKSKELIRFGAAYMSQLTDEEKAEILRLVHVTRASGKEGKEIRKSKPSSFMGK